MSRKRPTVSNIAPPILVCFDGGRPHDDGLPLTPAEADALRRRASLTHHHTTHLKAVRDPPLRAL